MNLLSVAEARTRMLALVEPAPSEEVALAACLGRVLAEPVVATRAQPPFAASAMDGWAVRSADGAGRLRVVGESAAGRAFAGTLAPGQTVRIFTGAPLPEGADAVVIQEDAQPDGAAVVVPAVAPGRHVRPAGQDFAAGTTLLASGLRLDPWRLGLAAAAGRATLAVARRPRVAILSSGDEIVEPGAAAERFQIFNSGGPSLAALLATWGAIAEPLAIAGDDLGALGEAAAGARCDLLVTLGGASVGDHDLVKPALARLGLELAVGSVAVRPGKPTWFGRLADGRLVLGLPGNPASALVCAELFLGPIVRAMQGAVAFPPLFAARSAAAMPANGGREQWLRARLDRDGEGRLLAEPFADQDSGLVTVFAAADALIRRNAGAPALAPGDPVEVLPLRRL